MIYFQIGIYVFKETVMLSELHIPNRKIQKYLFVISDTLTWLKTVIYFTIVHISSKYYVLFHSLVKRLT